MKISYSISSVFHITKADFLQRTRSYYFLIALGACIFIIYSFVPSIDAGYTIVSLGNYRGFYNSAWIGSMVAICVPFFALIGFYVVNDAVKRDIDTGVGQIIATTRISKVQYLIGKLISNFAVLLLISTVVAVMTIIMFLIRGETNHLELGKLLFPLLIIIVPAMFITAAIALFFDSYSNVNRGLINILYLFLWIFLIISSRWHPYFDVYGMNTCIAEIKNSISLTHLDWNGHYRTGILMTETLLKCKVFIWEGFTWNSTILLQRILWMAVSFGLVLFASLGFNRFDSIKTKEKKQRIPWFFKKRHVQVIDEGIHSRIKYHDIPLVESKFNYLCLLKAEIRLMLKGNSIWWLVISVGLFVTSAFASIGFSYKVALSLLWYFQVLILSKLGSREITHHCNQYIFAVPFPLRRQLPTTLIAAALILITISIPIILRSIIEFNFYGVYAIFVGAFFISSFAITSGIITRSSKLFEVIFTMMVYGILNDIPFVDFTGAIEESHKLGMAHYFLAITFALIILAFFFRKRQIRHSLG